jgi:flagellar assembly protein FliH
MSSSSVIPREKLSAYQRWELHSFDNAEEFAEASPQSHADAQSAANAELIRGSAYAAGLADGKREAAAKGADDVRRLQSLAASLARQGREINQALTDDLLGLALVLAKQMVRRALDIHPELITAVINDALTTLSGAASRLIVTLHPADAELVRTHLAEQIAAGAWQIVEDASLQRGGCMLQTATSQIDATVESRWRHLVSRLGQDGTWLD